MWIIILSRSRENVCTCVCEGMRNEEMKTSGKGGIQR